TGGYWSTYWYNGRIYGTEISRGLDVFELQPNDYLTADEIAAASLPELKGRVNAQTQEIIEWPAVPVVARAYLDQLRRDDTISAADASALESALDRAQALLNGGSANRGNTERDLTDLAEQFASGAGNYRGITGVRYASLAETLEGIAESL
ncbi:MAG: DUF305 domain-containing protein, partial [Gammaproteobacteria bacterium]